MGQKVNVLADTGVVGLAAAAGDGEVGEEAGASAGGELGEVLGRGDGGEGSEGSEELHVGYGCGLGL